MHPTFPGRGYAGLTALAAFALASCGGSDDTGRDGTQGSGSSAGVGGISVAPPVGAAGVGAGGGGAGGAGSVPTATGGSGSGTAGAGGAGGVGPIAGAAGSAGPSGPPPASCGDAARAYTVVRASLDASFTPDAEDTSWGGSAPRAPVAVDAATSEVYVGFTRSGATRSVVLAKAGGTPADAIAIEGAAIGGIAATSDGLAALLFDPNTDTDARTWVSVARFSADGSERFTTDLFRSPNLEDEGTKGAPTTARFAYVPGSDELVAYFGHTQRYDDGVRHQGGYLATIDASGEQSLIEGWFGSHNLDQRMLVDGANVAVLGLGDAFPKGIFFSFIDDARTNVIYRLASDGVGSTNGKLGGMVAFADAIVVPFVTNRDIAQDLDAGPWPDTDEAISMQIRDAAAAGKDLGLLAAPKADLPDGDLPPTWLEAGVAEGARMTSLKSAQYGTGELLFLAWAESTGDRRNTTSRYFTMVVDRMGAVCQAKVELTAENAFTPGDDIVRRADGSLVWANTQGGTANVVTLTP
jgi:hypothetical protein